MDEDAVRQALAFDPEWQRAARAAWLALMDLAVWGDLRSSRLGATAKIRKRALEIGEKFRSLAADRDWIPHPRERLKNALASALHVREGLDELERAAQALDGGADRHAFGARLAELQQFADALAAFENRWAALLDAQYRDNGE